VLTAEDGGVSGFAALWSGLPLLTPAVLSTHGQSGS
jgi:hypothetical protein